MTSEVMCSTMGLLFGLLSSTALYVSTKRTCWWSDNHGIWCAAVYVRNFVKLTIEMRVLEFARWICWTPGLTTHFFCASFFFFRPPLQNAESSCWFYRLYSWIMYCEFCMVWPLGIYIIPRNILIHGAKISISNAQHMTCKVRSNSIASRLICQFSINSLDTSEKNFL